MADGVTLAYSTRAVTKLSVIAIGFLIPQAVAADEVIMRNGDRLTGEVLRQDEQVLKLKTAYAGTLAIDWTEVREVKLDEPRKVLMDDETVVRIATVSRDADRLILRESPKSEPMTVDASQVKVIEPEPWELGEGYKLGGQVNVALKSERGNTHKNEIDFDYKLDYRRRWHRFESFGELEYDTERGDRTTDKWSTQNKYSRLFRSPWYAGVWLFFKHDRFADKRLRTIVGPTLGYRFFESRPLNLRTELGPVYLNDDFYDEPDQDFWGPAWMLDYDQVVWQDRLQLYHRQFGFWATDSSGKWLWRAWTGIRVPLVSGFVGSVEYEIDYDSEPAIKAETTDTTLRLKLGYAW